VQMEPYRESGYRRLMRMQVKNGDRGEAIRAYLECKRLLEAELGVGPSEETESLYREIAG
jgi:DNA-binding SARP family transcriptional activator